ncbi:hypothetical protein H2200_004066 [Cladophialophora chaetospira]|uniref:Transcription factor domain-containing protein n=1 Tax=Cladophialophora chaetospira TaxID=386627 RepID=A0AA39CKJ5_9EURO|nr:hypothetical protein H2200_004066 [Cladophialophora chaetospira]
MAQERNSKFSFIVSTPQNLDRQSLALRQARARSHAARISRLSSQGANIQAESGPSAISRPSPSRGHLVTTAGDQSHDQPLTGEDDETNDDNDDDEEDTTPSSDYEQPDVDYIHSDTSPRQKSSSPKNAVALVGSPGSSQRQRHKSRRGLTSAYMSPPKMDPLHFIPYRRHPGVYVAVGHFLEVSAPTVRPLYEMFNITSTYTSILFEFMMESEAFYHTAIARLLLTANRSRDPSAPEDSRVTLHQTVAMKQLREQIDKTTMPTDLMLLTVLFLIIVEVANGRSASVDIHRTNLARLVKLRGGLDKLGYDGFVKATIKQFDDIVSFERGPGTLLPRVLYCPIYPSIPFSRETQQLVSTLPDGFQYLAFQQILPLDIIELLSRINNAVRRSGGKNTYVPLSRTANPFHSQPGRYDSFSQACPCLFVPDDQVYPLLKPLTLALAVWSCNAYSEIRSAGLVVSGFLRSLTRRLQQMYTPANSPVGVQDDHVQSLGERECWIWIWIVGIDAWTSHDGQELHPIGKELFQCFKARFVPETVNPSILDRILESFFSTDDLRARVQSLWNETPIPSPP